MVNRGGKKLLTNRAVSTCRWARLFANLAQTPICIDTCSSQRKTEEISRSHVWNVFLIQIQAFQFHILIVSCTSHVGIFVWINKLISLLQFIWHTAGLYINTYTYRKNLDKSESHHTALSWAALTLKGTIKSYMFSTWWDVFLNTNFKIMVPDCQAVNSVLYYTAHGAFVHS